MNGKVIDSGANSIPLILLVLLPLALIVQLLFVAWPFFLAMIILLLGNQLWQKYRLQKLSEEIDPYFNQLVKAHQGSLTILDLCNKTELNAKTARWYLDQKTEEFGGVKREYEGKGIVYYFLTASSLGSIFDDSEPENDIEEKITVAPKININASPSPLITETKPSTSEKSTTVETVTPVTEEKPSEIKVTQSQLTEEKPPELKVTDTPPTAEKIPVTDISSQSPVSLIEEKESPSETEENHSMSLNQTDLAKRLEVHPSTVGKRKSDSDFGLWSQSRDPDGIPWQYVDDTKLFIPLE